MDSMPLCTALIEKTNTIDMATRVARRVVRHTRQPAYVGCSVVLPSGSTFEEIMSMQQVAFDAILHMIQKSVHGK